MKAGRARMHVSIRGLWPQLVRINCEMQLSNGKSVRGILVHRQRLQEEGAAKARVELDGVVVNEEGGGGA